MSAHGYVAGMIYAGTTRYFPFENHQWMVTGGYVGPVQPWLVPSDVADLVMAALDGSDAPGNEVSLIFGPEEAPSEVHRVIVLGAMPSDNPQKFYLLLTDVRWYFTHAVFCMDVNLRRRLGDKILLGNVLTDVTVADTVAYAPWSTNNGVAYTWDTLKTQVTTWLATARHGRPGLSWVFDSFNVITPPGQVVTDLSTDGSAEMALARAVESVPGAGVYVDMDGVLHVYERTLGAEDALITQFANSYEDHGSLIYADHANIRPINSDHSYRVYFDYEVEVRLTYNVTGSGLYSGRTGSVPYLTPVLRVTDLSLTIPSGAWSGSPRTVGQGTWITQDEAFAAWGTKSWGAFTLPQLTDDIVARHWFGDALTRYNMGQTVASFDSVWAARIQELMRCYRTYFRVNPTFWERVRHAFDVRAGIWDPVTGTRAPAPVYCNFNLTPSNIWTSQQVAIQGINHIDSYPVGEVLALGQPSGFRCSLEDEELGIICVDRNVLSKYAGHTDIAISPVKVLASVNETGAIMEAVVQSLILATTGGGGGTAQSPADGWKLAVILSLSPASPNDPRRLYEVKVDMTEAVDAAGLGDVDVAGNAPDKEIRSRVADSRVAWQDDTDVVANILAVFGANDTTDDIGTDDPVTGLVPVNLEQELRPLAQALAAADLMNKLDCWEGNLSVAQNDEIVPIGSLQVVTHKVMDGKWVSHVECVRAGPIWHAEDFLRGSSRNFLLKQIARAR